MIYRSSPEAGNGSPEMIAMPSNSSSLGISGEPSLSHPHTIEQGGIS